jgi:hypothetical protein
MYFIIFKDGDGERVVNFVIDETEMDVKIDIDRERVNE